MGKAKEWGSGRVGPERMEEEKPDNRFANNKKSLPWSNGESSNSQTNSITEVIVKRIGITRVQHLGHTREKE